MKTFYLMIRHPLMVSAAACAACLALAGCDREPTPKLSAYDPALANPTTNATTTATTATTATTTTTAPADTGTAMGTGSLAGMGPGGLTPSDTPRSTDGGNASFDNLTRDNPTGAGLPGGSTTQPTAAPTSAGPLSSAEQKFITQVGAKSLFEIRVSELAAEKAKDPALKSYAAMVVADHKGATEELKRLAAGHGLNLPETLLPADEKTLAALKNANGQAFDKQYLQTVGVNEHEKTIATFEKASADARNPAVKDYVQSTLPTLKAHLDAARKLQTKG